MVDEKQVDQKSASPYAGLGEVLNGDEDSLTGPAAWRNERSGLTILCEVVVDQ